MLLKAKFFILSLTLLLSACSYVPTSYFSNRSGRYLNAESVPPLRVPPGVAAQSIHNNYPVADRRYPKPNSQPSLIPPTLYP